MLIYFKKIYKETQNKFYKIIQTNLDKNKKMFIVTANPETFMIAEKDNDFSKLLLDDITTIVPDGIGIVKASRMLGYSCQERIPGIEIVNYLFKEGNNLNKSIYLFGANQNVIKLLETLLKKEYPHLKIVGAKNGYIMDKDMIFQDIIKIQPDIVLVALGIPHQEKLIYKYLNQFDKGIFVGVGGSFDVISGYKKRAPKILVKLNLEWLYRLIKEPKRIKRFYENNVKFMIKIFKIK
jgi:N-acetylglucosaminyldiphosphoundecaprenol N-acetyl-beta-D-mannosaminyltransferase